MAPSTVLAATALLATLSFTSAYDSSYGDALYARRNSLYPRHLSEDVVDPSLIARFAQKVLARRELDEEEDLHIRDGPCPPGCLCARHMKARTAEAEAEADPLFEHDDILFNYRRSIDTREAEAEADPLFEHDDILFNYKREADGGDSFFDDMEFFDVLARDIDTREAEAKADPDPIFEHDDILFNYKRDAIPSGTDSFFDDVEFFDVVARDEMNTREAKAEAEADPLFEHDDILFNYKREIDSRSASPSPDPDPIFEHDDILFNYRRSLDPFDDIEFTDLISRSTDPFNEIEFTDLISRSMDPFDELEFTDLIARGTDDGSFTPWYHSASAQARKGNYKSPGQVKAAQRGDLLAGTNADASPGSGRTSAGGLGGNAFNEALDAGSGGATSMDAAAMDAGGLGV